MVLGAELAEVALANFNIILSKRYSVLFIAIALGVLARRDPGRS
jgi:hypothetical protein